MENAVNDNSTNGNDQEGVSVLKSRLDQLEKREKELMKEKEEMEMEFGRKRAKLKDLYLQKEDELEKERATNSTFRNDKEDLEDELQHLRQELDECKSQVTVAWVTKDNIEQEKRKCEEELASVQQIMKDAVEDAVHNTSAQYEKEMSRLRKMNERLESENQDLRNQLSSDREGVLSVMTKTLAKRVVSLNAHSQSNENIHENLEDSMKKAQEDAEMLRSLVVPLEEEIKALKDKLRAADEQLRMHEATQANLIKGSNAVAELLKGRPPTEIVAELDDKLKELNEDLKAEKSSRSDLEMYVAVLQTQKTVLQEDTEKLRKELQEVCQLLENEKREHNELKQTWQMANDQFLEVQRLQIMDMRRMQSVLTMEQQRSLSELQKRDEERLEQERKVHHLLHIQQEQEKLKQADSIKRVPVSPILGRLSPRHRKSPSPGRADTPDSVLISGSAIVKDFFNFDRAKSDPSSLNQSLEDVASASSPISLQSQVTSELQRSLSSSVLTSAGDKSDYLDSGIHEESEANAETEGTALNLQLGDRIPNLSEAQFKALADITPEQEARKQLMENARSRPYTLVVPQGKRLVSEKEWQLLQEQLKKARDKLGRTCDMCSNYEAQLQKVQEHEKEMEKNHRTLEKTIESVKDELQREQQYRKEVEIKASETSEKAKIETAELVQKIEEFEKLFAEVRQQYTNFHSDILSQVKYLSTNRERVQEELTRLQKENDSLVCKHTAHAQQMQNEPINLPSNREEMELLLLKLREELIGAKVAKEHIEETLKSEIMFLKDQIMAEQHTKDTIEDTLSQEIDTLRGQVGILESIKHQKEQEHSRRIEAEKQVKTLQAELAQKQAKSKQIIQALQKQLEEQTKAKASSENEVYELKCKVQGLQVDLDNNEAVQRDFVKLSQSLQVELEKIRQSETEVRWQHEDDVEDCNSCKQAFSVTRRKHHCRHCGKIFCNECTTKMVPSGPNRRLSRVCDVCHTLLVRDTAPYFSNEPPHTPD